MGAAGADIFLPGAGAKKILSGAGAEEKWLGSSTLNNGLDLSVYPFFCLTPKYRNMFFKKNFHSIILNFLCEYIFKK